MISNNIGISTGFSVSGENAVIYQQLIEGIPEPAYLCDAAGYIIIYNQSAAGLWGISRHPVINKEQWKKRFPAIVFPGRRYYPPG